MKQPGTNDVSMTNKILDLLREDINNCVYASGQFITEAERSDKFHVSKTPAREALIFLCQEGLLERIPRKGYLVKQLSVAELQSLFQFRSILERAAVELAIRFASDGELKHIEELAHQRVNINDEDFYNQYNNLNVRFHLSIAQLSKNPYLVSSLQNVLNRLRRDLVLDVRSNLEKSLDAHILVVEAIKKRDLEQAMRVTADQIEVVEKRLYLR